MGKLIYEPIQEGDTAGRLEYQALRKGVPLPGVLGSTVSVRAVIRGSGVVVLNDVPGVVVDAAEAVVGYNRQVSDFTGDTPIVLQFTINFPGGDKHVSPDIHVRVLRDLP